MNSPSAEDFKAQNGEDRILIQEFADQKAGFCMEVGAYDGIDMSNSYLFERLGWKCLLIEADPEMAATCHRNRPAATVVNCAVVAPGSPSHVTFQVSEDVKGMSSLGLDDDSRRRITGYAGRLTIREITTPARTLDAVLEEAKCPPIDFMTIDVEGHELGVLKGFDIGRWKPRLVLVERASIFPLWSILQYFDRTGYVLRRRTGANDWFYQEPRHKAGSLKLFLRFYLLPFPRLLPQIIGQGVKGVFFKLGIYKGIVRIFGK